MPILRQSLDLISPPRDAGSTQRVAERIQRAKRLADVATITPQDRQALFLNQLPRQDGTANPMSDSDRETDSETDSETVVESQEMLDVSVAGDA
jgi:hypothetical protein